MRPIRATNHTKRNPTREEGKIIIEIPLSEEDCTKTPVIINISVWNVTDGMDPEIALPTIRSGQTVVN